MPEPGQNQHLPPELSVINERIYITEQPPPIDFSEAPRKLRPIGDRHILRDDNESERQPPGSLVVRPESELKHRGGWCRVIAVPDHTAVIPKGPMAGECYPREVNVGDRVWIGQSHREHQALGDYIVREDEILAIHEDAPPWP